MEEKSIAKELLGWVRDIAIAIIIALLILNFVGGKISVFGKSMEPTLYDNDQLIIDKLSYRFKDVERFDIIVFPHESKLFYIKRVIALPGETVNIVDGKVLVNDKVIDGDYEFDDTHDYGDSLPLTVPEDEYFVMGDNRNNSSDSRRMIVGTIHKDIILGKATFRIWPLKTFGKFK